MQREPIKSSVFGVPHFPFFVINCLARQQIPWIYDRVELHASGIPGFHISEKAWDDPLTSIWLFQKKTIGLISSSDQNVSLDADGQK